MSQIASLPKFDLRPGMRFLTFGGCKALGTWVLGGTFADCICAEVEGYSSRVQRGSGECLRGAPLDLSDRATQGAIVGLLEDVRGRGHEGFVPVWLEPSICEGSAYWWTVLSARLDGEPCSEDRGNCTTIADAETREAALEAACMEVLR